MLTVETAAKFLRSVKRYDSSMGDPAEDAEIDAASEMRDCALALLVEASAENPALRALASEGDRLRP